MRESRITDAFAVWITGLPASGKSTIARHRISKFVEVYLECPLATCMARDPQGIYRRAHERKASTVSGFRTAYEAPEKPEVVLHGDQDAPEDAARCVLTKLAELAYV